MSQGEGRQGTDIQGRVLEGTVACEKPGGTGLPWAPTQAGPSGHGPCMKELATGAGRSPRDGLCAPCPCVACDAPPAHTGRRERLHREATLLPPGQQRGCQRSPPSFPEGPDSPTTGPATEQSPRWGRAAPGWPVHPAEGWQRSLLATTVPGWLASSLSARGCGSGPRPGAHSLLRGGGRPLGY